MVEQVDRIVSVLIKGALWFITAYLAAHWLVSLGVGC